MNQVKNDRVIEDMDILASEAGGGRKGHVLGNIRKYSRGLLSDRQLAFLTLCFEQYFLMNTHVHNWLKIQFNFSSHDSCRVSANQMLGNLADKGLIEIVKPQVQSFNYYNVTTRGIKLLIDHGLIPENASYVKLDESTFKHDSISTAVRLVWDKIGDFEDWESSRVLKLIKDSDTAKIPDLVTPFNNGKLGKMISLAMEIEMTRKTDARYSGLFNDYNQSEYDIIFYFVSSEKLRNTILKLSRCCHKEVYLALIGDFLDKGANTKMVSHSKDFIIGKRFKN